MSGEPGRDDLGDFESEGFDRRLLRGLAAALPPEALDDARIGIEISTGSIGSRGRNGGVAGTEAES